MILLSRLLVKALGFSLLLMTVPMASASSSEQQAVDLGGNAFPLPLTAYGDHEAGKGVV